MAFIVLKICCFCHLIMLYRACDFYGVNFYSVSLTAAYLQVRVFVECICWMHLDQRIQMLRKSLNNPATCSLWRVLDLKGMRRKPRRAGSHPARCNINPAMCLSFNYFRNYLVYLARLINQYQKTNIDFKLLCIYPFAAEGRETN